MNCIGICKNLTGGNGCTCKVAWRMQLELFREHFKRERLHEKGMCDCDVMCIYPDSTKFTTPDERNQMLDAWSEQEYYNYQARYNQRIFDMKRQASLLVKQREISSYWIRATFPKDQKLEEIHSIMQRIVKLKPFSGIICNVEFWSDEGNNFNPHSHMLIPKNCKKSKVIKDLARILKVKENMIECKEIYKDKDLKIKYINGDKQETKKINVVKDNETREKYNIDRVYNAS